VRWSGGGPFLFGDLCRAVFFRVIESGSGIYCQNGINIFTLERKAAAALGAAFTTTSGLRTLLKAKVTPEDPIIKQSWANLMSNPMTCCGRPSPLCHGVKIYIPKGRYSRYDENESVSINGALRSLLFAEIKDADKIIWQAKTVADAVRILLTKYSSVIFKGDPTWQVGCFTSQLLPADFERVFGSHVAVDNVPIFASLFMLSTANGKPPMDDRFLVDRLSLKKVGDNIPPPSEVSRWSHTADLDLNTV